jgi:hypothetical protein
MEKLGDASRQVGRNRRQVGFADGSRPEAFPQIWLLPKEKSERTKFLFMCVRDIGLDER